MKTTRIYLKLLAALVIVVPVSLPHPAAAETTIQEGAEFAWSPNVGWMDWRGDVTSGAAFGSTFLSGYIWSANIGWIDLGDGTPAGGTSYSNTSAGDFGVNIDAGSDPDNFLLSGFAYAPNAGWINFDIVAQAGAVNRPRIEKTTGFFKGFAWGANIGWIALDSLPFATLRNEFAKNASRNWNLYE